VAPQNPREGWRTGESSGTSTLGIHGWSSRRQTYRGHGQSSFKNNETAKRDREASSRTAKPTASRWLAGTRAVVRDWNGARGRGRARAEEGLARPETERETDRNPTLLGRICDVSLEQVA